MILYVDETECEDYFKVAGLLTESKLKTDLAYKHFKKKLKTLKLSTKDKEKVFLEFKAVILDRHYQRIKIKMLKEINQLDHSILFSAYTRKGMIPSFHSSIITIVQLQSVSCPLNRVISFTSLSIR